MDLALRRFRASEKKQVVDDPGKSGALRHARFDHRYIFVRRTLASQRHLGFAANIGQWSTQFMGEIGRELGETGEGTLEPVEHVVEGDRDRLQLPRPFCRRNSLVKL